MSTPSTAIAAPTALPLLYRNVTALSRDRHRGWYFDADQGYSFARPTNSVYLAAGEFAAAAREFAIVFTRDASGSPIPAALLGLATDTNLFVGAEGEWRGRYVPAYLRRYPFMLATTNEAGAEFTVCIDETFSGFNTAREGEQLIDDEGEQCPLLLRSVEFLREFHQHTERTTQFCAALDRAQVLEGIQANIALDGATNFSLTGMFCVNRERLGRLDAQQLKALFDPGYLELIFLHLNSLANLDRLIELMRLPAAPTGAADKG